MGKCWWSLALVGIAALTVVSASNKYRLNESVLPIHYDLRLLIDVNPETNFTYYGIVHILVNAQNATNKITLHGKQFSVNKDNVKVTGADDSYEIKDVSREEELDLINIQLDRNLDARQNYTLVIPFYGNLRDELDGIYVSSYQNKTTNQKEYLITTQFEAIYARKGFPCFDEPAMKATFAMTLGHNRGFSAVSNMPLVRTTDTDTAEDNWIWDEMMKIRSNKLNTGEMIWDQFETSVPMSTYLVAFVISRFAHLDSPEELSKAKFSIWARSDAIKQAEYASSVGPKVLTYYEKYFGVPYPLPKQDMFAIPDFSAGAMENWGLITYRETALLYDEKESSLTAKERVAEVIAHELAHQWFGNLVTMKWWSDLWLNEGFATYVASVGVDAVESRFNSVESNAVGNALSVFALDSLESSHPVSVVVDDPSLISEIFDDISYNKGSQIIRMMVMFLGEDVFRNGITNYLKKYTYSNAEQDDLWKALTEAAVAENTLPGDLTVKQIMDTWTKQTGYPLVTVRRNYIDGSVFVTQKRYLALESSSKSNASWWLPLHLLMEGAEGAPDKPVEAWLGRDEGYQQEHKLEQSADKDKWLLLNANMIGIYRVNYDAQNWAKLIKVLDSDRFGTVPNLSRVQLLTDSFQLAWTNVLNYTVAFGLANYLRRETSLLPMSTGLGELERIEGVLSRTIDYGAFQKYMRKLIVKAYQDNGGVYAKKILDPEDVNKVKMQTMTSRWACRAKVPSCEQNCIDMFDQWMHVQDPDTNNPIPLDLRSIVYCTAISRGSVQHWVFLFQRYLNSNVAAAKRTIMSALTCTKEIWILKQYLEWAVDDGPEVRNQDAPAVIAGITRSSVGYYVAKDFIYSRIQDIDRAFYGQSRRMGGIVKGLAGEFTTQEELDEFMEWRTKNEKYLKDTKLAVEQAIEVARVNINWLKKNQKDVVALLRLHASD